MEMSETSQSVMGTSTLDENPERNTSNSEEAETEERTTIREDSDGHQEEEEFLLQTEEEQPLSSFQEVSNFNVLTSSSSSSSSLAFSSATPILAKILLPILCIGCHALFYYGQTAPMWKLRAFAEIDAWANATDVGNTSPPPSLFYCHFSQSY